MRCILCDPAWVREDGAETCSECTADIMHRKALPWWLADLETFRRWRSAELDKVFSGVSGACGKPVADQEDDEDDG